MICAAARRGTSIVCGSVEGEERRPREHINGPATSTSCRLTAEEVAGLLGEPNNGRIQPCVDCSFTYLPPLGSLTANKNGYTGLRIWFTGGKVSAWHIYTGNPSYAEPTMPPGLRRFAWFFGIMFAFGIISKLLIRLTPVATVVAAEVAPGF